MNSIAKLNYLMCVAGDFTGPIRKLAKVLITVSGALGAVIVIYGAIRFALAFQKLDQQGEHQATLTIVAGGILIGISAVLGVLGVAV
ncbi:hypothetical protein SAMN04487829_1988 [Pseudobutyrivibrio sp. NOR37]|uniref:Uncharacterized protein n=1 Tax=Pseudobutyrivibrio xylanivorans TaxID=185007 RepID=A0A6M0LNG0_PSEXY|nr:MULTISPECIES: hypothetical protein [Pseudobutyrivibrio]NEX02361.1 hypothetical protein [Pseudobutyrivibrio xylanivorans]SFR78508.1 hypothetical protein SAMN04487829_1988 [Pseudobutyrivibrio sp. NOR37]